QVARGWISLEITGSNAGLGGVYLGFGVPMLLLTPFGGVAADRLPKRLVLVVAEALLVVSAVWIGVAVAFHFIQYWMLVVGSAVQGAGFSVYGPTRVAFTGELVDRTLLSNAVVLTQMSVNSS